MKYIRKFNESNGGITESDIESIFADTFDLASDFKIEEVYFSTSNLNDWAHNDFSKSDGDCSAGFCVTIDHDFYARMEINDLHKYSELINTLLSDIKMFEKVCNPHDIFMEEGGNSSFLVLINLG